MIKAAVVGCTGYSGQELVDVLIGHPDVDLKFITARFDEEVKYADVYPRFAGRTDLVCSVLDVDKIASACDVVFLALPHTVSMDVAPAFLDKMVHFGEYFILTMLLTRSLIYSYKMKRKELCYLAVAIALLYAFVDEAHQFLVPPREPDLLDFVSDVIGSAFGTVTYFFLFLKKKEK